MPTADPASHPNLDPSTSTTEAPVVFAVLGISSHREDLATLGSMFQRRGWKFHEARSLREASAILCAHWVPLIICDRSLADGNWKDILSLTAPLLEMPRVIVAVSPAF